MTEEESFVILGSSPNESLENYTIVNNAKPEGSIQHDTNVEIASSNLLDSLRSDSPYKKDYNSMTASSNNFSMLNGSPVLESAEGIQDNLSGGPISKHVDIWSTSGAIGKHNNVQGMKTSANFSMINGTSVLENAEEIDGNSQEGLVPKFTDFWSTSGATGKQNTAQEMKMSKTSFSGDTNQSGTNSPYHSMTNSFLIGKVDPEVIKAKVYSEFPSLCGSQAKMEDIRKLQNFMIEYEEMKNNIRKTNASMRQQFTMIQKWQTEVATFKETQEKRFVEYQEAIAKLQDENLEIKKELKDKIEQIELNEKWMKKENEDLVKLVSEKSSIIENMGFQIEKLEQNQNLSFEYVRGNRVDEPPQEFIRLCEHKTMLKDFEKKMDEILAEKLELQDMKKIYIDELNCLKVNLTSAEELLKQYRVEIDTLKNQHTDKENILKKFEEEKTEMKQEIEILKMQIAWYRKDFEVERSAKDNLVREKEQLLEDLKMLQRRNHQMIEEAAARMEINDGTTQTTGIRRRVLVQPKLVEGVRKFFHERPQSSTKTFMLSSTKVRATEPAPTPDKAPVENSFTCPLCGSTFNCLDRLETHVQQCLDN